jgi:hypothetical protein
VSTLKPKKQESRTLDIEHGKGSYSVEKELNLPTQPPHCPSKKAPPESPNRELGGL